MKGQVSIEKALLQWKFVYYYREWIPVPDPYVTL